MFVALNMCVLYNSTKVNYYHVQFSVIHIGKYHSRVNSTRAVLAAQNTETLRERGRITRVCRMAGKEKSETSIKQGTGAPKWCSRAFCI